MISLHKRMIRFYQQNTKTTNADKAIELTAERFNDRMDDITVNSTRTLIVEYVMSPMKIWGDMPIVIGVHNE